MNTQQIKLNILGKQVRILLSPEIQVMKQQTMQHIRIRMLLPYSTGAT
jgi:hypothetical protein